MKFTDVRTLSSVLKEYGLKPGTPTPVGQQPTVGIPAPSKEPTKAPKKDLGSPTVTPGLDIPNADEPEAITPLSVKAKDFDDGSEYLNDKGEVAGKVISKVGKGPAIKKLVVQDPDGEYTLIDPEEELLAAPVAEAKGGKYSKKVHKDALRKTSKSKNSISSVKQKIKKLARKVQMQEQGTEQLFELNFNTKEIVQSGLDSPIKCGFEAESLWEGYEGGSPFGDPDQMNWSDIEDIIDEQYGQRQIDEIRENFNEWIMEEKLPDYEADIVRDLIIDRKDDMAYMDEYIERASPLSDEDLAINVAQYKKDSKRKDPDEYESKIEDGWTDDNWRREFVEINFDNEFVEWLEDEIRDNGDAFEPAMEAALEDLSIEDWKDDSYNGYWSSLLADHEVYIGDENGEHQDLEGIGDEIRNWAQDNSITDSIEVGTYGSGGINNAYWRVEDDSSIEGDGTGSEIISPVYGTPREMLEEMSSLFSNWEGKDVATNGSTGLHVTMSIDPTRTGMPASAEVNKVKLAVLLGDKYLASTFGRENNSYTKSQYERLEQQASALKADPSNTKTIKNIEDILEAGISSDKFSSINFKNQQDDSSGHNLIEFRIGGGHDYHEDMPKIVKAVVRYATTLRAGYTEEFNQDYVKALFKLINNVGKISTDMENRVKDRYELEHPVVDVLKGFFSKDNYMECVGLLARAFKHLNQYKEASEPAADEKWKQQVDQWEKQTGETHERLKEAPTPREAVVDLDDPRHFKTGISKPQKRPPSVQAPKMLEQAQEYFAQAITQAGYDLSQNLNRATVNAKAIGILRKTLPEFELTYETLSNEVIKFHTNVVTGEPRGGARNSNQEKLFARVKNGVDRLFKKDILVAPNFLNGPQLEKIVLGIWNAMNSGENLGDDKKLIDLIVNASAKDTNYEDVSTLLSLKGENKVTFSGPRLQKFNTYTKLHREIASNEYSWFFDGNAIQSKDYTALIKKLKTYPVWDEEVAKTFDSRNPKNDSYGSSVSAFADASIESMMGKIYRRIQTVDKLYTTNPELYIKSIKQLANSTEELINVVHAPDPADEDERFGHPAGFTMNDRTYEKITQVIKANRAANFRPSPFDEASGEQIYELIHRYFKDGLAWYYADGSDGPGKLGPAAGLEQTPLEIREMKIRTNAIEKFLHEVDKISQNMGFDSVSGQIDRKLQQHTRGSDFQMKHQGPAPATVKVFHIGGYVFVNKGLASEMQQRDREMYPSSFDATQENGARFYKNFVFTDNMFESDNGNVIIVPHAYYFAALEAYKMLESNKSPDDPSGAQTNNISWRKPVCIDILRKWNTIYNVTFKELFLNQTSHAGGGGVGWVRINKSELRDQGIEVKDAGDGREGGPPHNFDPLLPREEINGPGGEPFELSSAAVWRINNPNAQSNDDWDKENDSPNPYAGKTPKEIFKSLPSGNPDGQEQPLPQYSGNEFSLYKARQEFRTFDNILNSDWQLYFTGPTLNDLADYLASNNSTISLTDKNKILSAIIRNKREGINHPVSSMEFAKELVQQYDANPEESVFNKFDKLTLEEQIYLLNKVDDGKLNKVYEIFGGGGVPDYKTMPAYKLKKAKKGKHKFFVPSNEPTPKGVAALEDVVDGNFPIQQRDREMQQGNARELKMYKVLERLAQMWWNNDEDPAVEQKLEDMGWSIGEDEGSDTPSVFVVEIGDEHGNSYISWPIEQLENDVVEDVADTLTLPKIKVGDEVKVGKFKNRKAEVTGFDKDENNHPLLKTTKGNQQVFKPRISKLMKESVFNKFDKLALEEQIDLLNKVNDDKLNKVYETLAANTTHLAPPPKKKLNFRYPDIKKKTKKVEDAVELASGEHRWLVVYKDGNTTEIIAPNTYGVRRRLAPDERIVPKKGQLGIKRIEKISQPGRKPKGSFGFNNKGFTADQRAQKKIDDLNARIGESTIKEGVPNLNKIRILNKILADHFPVSDLYKQMLAYEAIPIPQMLTDFRGLRAGSGDNACARGVVRHYIQALSKEEQKQINLQEWSKNKVRALIESKGIMGRVYGDTFLKGDDKLEFKQVDLYPLEEMQFENAESRDVYIQQLEQENNLQIEWTNKPNNGSLAFGLAMLTDPMLDDKITYWGRYFRTKTANMMGKWGNSQVPVGWKLQTAGAMKLDIGIDPQHLIATPGPFNGVIEVIQAVKTNSAGTELSDSLVTALETIHTQQHPVFPGQIANLPALRDYFGEIMGPIALMSEMVGGQADDAKADLLNGQPWASCSVSWPMAMNAPLVDSEFTAPDGTIVGISSKGGKGAKASVKNIHEAIADAPEEMKAQYQTTVNIVNIVSEETAKDGPFRLAEMYGALPEGLEAEINGYIQEGKKDYAGISPAATELFNYGTPRQDVPGFNVGFALVALLAKKVTRLINEAGPEFGLGCVAFLNQSSIVQLYCKMGKNGQDARVTGWDAVYPPNFQGTVQIDGSKNYYSSRIGGKFAFGFK